MYQIWRKKHVEFLLLPPLGQGPTITNSDIFDV